MQATLQAVATLLALVNPAMCIALYMRAGPGKVFGQRFSSALNAVLSISAILTIAALAGTRILELFGVSLSAFSVAGGAILVMIGTKMMLPPAQDEKSADEDQSGSMISLILFGASPGTITGVITIAAANESNPIPLVTLIAIAIVMAILLAVLLVAARFAASETKPSATRAIITSYMGLIVIAMGVQFALSGWKAFMAT